MNLYSHMNTLLYYVRVSRQALLIVASFSSSWLCFASSKAADMARLPPAPSRVHNDMERLLRSPFYSASLSEKVNLMLSN